MLTRLTMASQVRSARWAFNCSAWQPSETDWQLLASGLDAEDKDRVGKFVFRKDAKSAMAGSFLIKKFLCEASGLGWQDINILRDSEHQKPYFPHSPEVQFNISHSGDFVVLAGEVGRLKLGVDLMKVEKQRTTTVQEFFRLMTKQFAPEEWAVVRSQETEAGQMAMFYRFWCLKESYTKATGTGITVDLQRICFKLKDFTLFENVVVDSTEVYVEGCRQEGWKFEETLLNKEHSVTVAISCPDVHSLYPSSDEHLFRVLSYPELLSCYQQISEFDNDYCRRFMAKRERP